MITTVLVIGEGERAQAAVREITDDIGETAVIHSFKRTQNLADWGGPGAGATAVALVVLVPGDDDNVDDLIESVIAHPASPDPRILLVTDRPYLDDISRALDRRDVAGVVAAPWTPGVLARYTRAEVSRWLRVHAQGESVPEPPPVGSDLLRDLRWRRRPTSCSRRSRRRSARARASTSPPGCTSRARTSTWTSSTSSCPGASRSR